MHEANEGENRRINVPADYLTVCKGGKDLQECVSLNSYNKTWDSELRIYIEQASS